MDNMKGVKKMKKQLLIAGLSSLFVIAGCGQSEENADKNKENEKQSQEEATNGDKQEKDNAQLQSTLLDNQMDLTKELRPHNVAVLDIKDKISNLKTIKDEKELNQAKTDVKNQSKEAQKEVEKAIKKIESFSIKGELSEDHQKQFNNALADLKAYFTEVKTVLNNPVEADFSKAEEKFSSFEEKIGTLYKEVDLISPNMKKELS